MTTLHMKTEEVRNAAHQLDLAVEDLYLKPYKLKSAAGSLRSAWQGGKSAYYANQLQQMGNTLREEVMHLQRLVKRLYVEVDEWEDGDGTGSFSNMVPVVPTIGMIGMIGATKFVPKESSFDWYTWGNESTKGSLKLLEKLPYDSKINWSYSGIGRSLNNALGNEKAGFVGFMDKTGHILKSPVIQDGIPLGLGIIGDLRDGDSPNRAIGSEVIEFAIDKGLYAIPIVGQVYMGYQIGMTAGHIFAGGLELFGMHNEAVQLQNTLNKLDFSEKLGDAIYDFVANPPDISIDVELEVKVKAKFSFGLGFD